MSLTITIAPVRKTAVVKVDTARAFEIFTNDFNRWWPKVLPADPQKTLHNNASSAVRESLIEPFKSGRWYTKCEDGSEVDIGHVLVWEPGRRLVLSWEFNAHWKSDANAHSEVEVNFIAESPDTTRVELEHRNFERLGKDGGEKMRRDVAGGWTTLVDLFAEEVARQSR